jgi:hypothetical protein
VIVASRPLEFAGMKKVSGSLRPAAIVDAAHNRNT